MFETRKKYDLANNECNFYCVSLDSIYDIMHESKRPLMTENVIEGKSVYFRCIMPNNYQAFKQLDATAWPDNNKLLIPFKFLSFKINENVKVNYKMKIM